MAARRAARPAEWPAVVVAKVEEPAAPRVVEGSSRQEVQAAAALEEAAMVEEVVAVQGKVVGMVASVGASKAAQGEGAMKAGVAPEGVATLATVAALAVGATAAEAGAGGKRVVQQAAV